MANYVKLINPDAIIHYVDGKLDRVTPPIAPKNRDGIFVWKIVPHAYPTEVCFEGDIPFDDWSGPCKKNDDDHPDNEIQGHVADEADYKEYKYSVRDIENGIIIDPIIRVY